MTGKKIPVFDGHCDTATRLVTSDEIDIRERSDEGHVDIPRMIEGGVSAQVFACWVDPDTPPEKWGDYALKMIGKLHEIFEVNSDEMALARSGSEVSAENNAGRIAALIGVEGGHAIGNDIATLKKIHVEGVRCMTLTWNNNNEIADSCEGGDRWNGLSPFGREVIGEMNRSGMVIDLSHSSDRTFYDVLEESADPVLVSHSCMRELCDHPRNMTDDMLAALAENGGVVGINFFPGFLETECSRETFALWDVYKRERSVLAAEYGGDVIRADAELQGKYRKLIAKIAVPGVGTVVDHIEYAVKVAGVEHVGIGSDFDGTPMMPEGLKDISMMQSIAAVMSERGYSDNDIECVMSGNMLRLFTDVCG